MINRTVIRAKLFTDFFDLAVCGNQIISEEHLITDYTNFIARTDEGYDLSVLYEVYLFVTNMLHKYLFADSVNLASTVQFDKDFFLDHFFDECAYNEIDVEMSSSTTVQGFWLVNKEALKGSVIQLVKQTT